MQTPGELIYLDPLKSCGPKQMAIDLFLLEKSFIDKNFQIGLRFYTWDGDWLSIGKNQTKLPKKWLELIKNEKLKIVRRPSGGKAVLHSRGLTYALVWKYPPTRKKESYLKITQWLKDGFKKAGLDLFFGNEPVNISNNNCFSTSTIADLVDKNKTKYIGSAQYWKKGHLLQHGEILMEPSKKIWRDIFDNDPPNIKISLMEQEKIIFLLKESFTKTWPNLLWIDYKLNKRDIEIIRDLSKDNMHKLNYF